MLFAYVTGFWYVAVPHLLSIPTLFAVSTAMVIRGERPKSLVSIITYYATALVLGCALLVG